MSTETSATPPGQQSRTPALRVICDEIRRYAMPWVRPDANLSVDEIRALFARVQEMRREDGDQQENLWLVAVGIQRIIDGLTDYPADKRWGRALSEQGLAIVAAVGTA
jgi:hypothetical protein